MDYKSETKNAYDRYAEQFEEKFGAYFKNVQEDADLFIKNLKSTKILDLGSGPGNHAEYFKSKGLDVLCGDISEAMVKRCREKGLRAEVMDMENLTLPSGSYDGVWAYTSLIHIPKANLPHVRNEIARILKNGGVLGVAVKEGSGEGFEENQKYPGTKRWFTYFTDTEMKDLFKNGFRLIHSSQRETDPKHIFLSYLFKKEE